MLRSVQRTPLVRSVALAQRSLSATVPTNKTLLLSHLPASVTSASLNQALAEVTTARAVYLQPGCVLHVADQTAADAVVGALKTPLRASVGAASLPSLQLKNLPTGVTESQLMTSFSEFEPLLASVQGGASKGKVVLRLNAGVATSATEVSELLAPQLLGRSDVKTNVYVAPRPAVVVRNLGELSLDTVRSTFDRFGALSMGVLRPTADSNLEAVHLYFGSEEAALKCLLATRGMTVDGVRMHVSYRALKEAAVSIGGLPEDVTDEEIIGMFGALSVNRVERTNGRVVVVLDDAKNQTAAVLAAHKTIRGMNVTDAQPIELGDMVVELSHGGNLNAAEVASAALVDVRGTEETSGVEAEIAFKRVKVAHKAVDAYARGSVSVGENNRFSPAVLSTRRSVAIEVDGLPTNKSVEEFVAALEAKDAKAKVLQADRSALISLKQPKHMVYTQKQLKKLEIDGKKVRVERYLPAETLAQGVSGYDKIDMSEEVSRMTMEEFVDRDMKTSPATRYQLALNSFQRTLPDAIAAKSVDALLGLKGLTKSAREEASELLAQCSPNTPVPDDIAARLFSLYVQRQDMLRFTRDFAELEAIYGKANPDASNWSGFEIETNEQLARLFEKANVLGYKATLQTAYDALGEGYVANHLLRSEDDDEEFDEMMVNEDDEDEEEFDIEEFDEDFDEDFEAEDDEEGDEEDEEEEADEDEEEGDEEEADDDDEEYDEEYDEDNEEYDEEDYDEEPMDLNSELTEEQLDQIFPNTGNLFESPEFILNKTVQDADEAKVAAMQLTDAEGRVWSGVVLANDHVQKTTAGGRVPSNRCLVMIGNLRGAGGFGTGKGKNNADALVSAFRDALRNVVHLDLYENAALIHDMKGKHNSCRAYVRATPQERVMIASPFAKAILTRLGISSASVKFTGRRDPYAMANALFKALVKHQNIDETAKIRGKRYLTLKFARDNGL